MAVFLLSICEEYLQKFERVKKKFIRAENPKSQNMS